ncbi:hypothetical protein CMT52_08810 [Elizabethkingia anophelis]|nr:hypothetical protein [Elizabethkingia anophelis]
MNAKDIIEYRKKHNLTQEQFAELMGVSKNTIYNYENGGVIPKTKIPKLKSILFGNENSNIVIEKESEINPKPLANGRLIQKQHRKMVTKIPAKSQLGLQGTSFKEDFIGKLEQYEIYTEDHESGRYFEIECIGDSMDSGDPRTAILEGDEIRVREIPRENYINNQLHFHEWDEFTFFHYDRDIITKHVLDHDVENRKVLLHSYNPDKKNYPDEWIDLNDCYIVCNVIEVTRPRGYKKRLKKLNGTK